MRQALAERFHKLVARPTCGVKLFPMPFRNQIIAALVLIICLACPVLEMFDRWDHTAQTGQDSEYTFVVLAVCVGAGFTFVRPIFRSGVRAAREKVFATSAGLYLFSAELASVFMISNPLSPPVSLRI